MIKLENAGSLPQARCLVALQSETEVPSVSLSTEDVREEKDGKWETSAANVRQVVSAFVDHKPFKLSGKIASAYAVECPAAFKVVVEVEVKVVLSTAYEKGDKSKEGMQISLVRVVEVWGTAAKRLWSAYDGGNGASKPPLELDSNGRIGKPAAIAARS